MDWRRIAFTEHMTEAAAVEAVCHVVFDFGGGEQATYEITVLRVLKGGGAPYFATGRDRDRTDAFRPFGEGDTPEAAVQACLESAGVHHRRHERQRPE
jgi:hypothetical protein